MLAQIGPLGYRRHLARHGGFTLGILATGFAIGGGVGLALGVLLARSARLARWLNGPILVLQTAPKIALAPLFVIWFGLGITSKLVLVASLVFFPVMVGTLLGMQAVDARLLDLTRILRMPAWRRLLRIELPSAAPAIFTGLRVGIIQAVVGAVLGEWMSGSRGLGFLMTQASAQYRTPALFAAVLLIVALGLVLYGLIDTIERRALRWRG